MCNKQPNEESQTVYTFHFSFFSLKTTFGENCWHFFVINRIPTDTWSLVAHIHSLYGQQKNWKLLTHFGLCVCFNMNLSEIKSNERRSSYIRIYNVSQWQLFIFRWQFAPFRSCEKAIYLKCFVHSFRNSTYAITRTHRLPL